MMSRTFVTILDKRWELVFVPARELPSNSDGECDAPSKTAKQIRIYDKLNDERTLTILIHEMLHAADWHKDESWVEKVAEQIARAATRIGFKRTEET